MELGALLDCARAIETANRLAAPASAIVRIMETSRALLDRDGLAIRVANVGHGPAFLDRFELVATAGESMRE